MIQRRTAQLPLHGGKAPPWLFKRMSRLAGAITMTIVEEYGPAEMLRRLSDPWWFQAFGCVLGFDWHSSGLTTVTCGALKQAQRHFGNDLGIFVAGGKGGTSRKTPHEIEEAAQKNAISQGNQLVRASKLSAKVDSAGVQDGYQIYAHSFFFLQSGEWCVVQQGMNDNTGLARRYHWLGSAVDNFVCEPHKGLHDSIVPVRTPELPNLLNMTALEAEKNRQASTLLINQNPDKLLEQIRLYSQGPTLFAPNHHQVLPSNINLARLRHIIYHAHEEHPQDFQTLLGSEGVGPATVRALSLLAEVIHQAPASHRDLSEPPPDSQKRHWADYSYAHGGKDGTPFPVDRKTYDKSISVLLDAVRKAKLDHTEKRDALRRLASKQSLR